MEDNYILNKRKERIMNWIKNPYNCVFLGILIFAIIIRLYYFFLTKNQPLWWDEAEYMNMARAWAFHLPYEFLPVRPVLLSLITAIFFKISYGEFLPRIFILLFSIASVTGMYYLGKEVYNKKAGLIASFLMSIFYLNLFFSFRLLVEIPSLTCFIFAGFFFLKYFKENSNRFLYIATIITAVGTLFRLTSALILFVVLIYVLMTEKLNCFKKKEYWIAALIFILILIPYFIWGYFQFKGFVIKQAMGWNPSTGIVNSLSNLKFYILNFSNYLSWSILLIFLIGLLTMHKVFLGLDLIFKGKGEELKAGLFLILLFLIPAIFPSFSLGHAEDRYILNAFPAIFIVISLTILTMFNIIKKKQKALAIIFLIIFVVFVLNFQFKSADSLIKGRVDSYSQVRDAGLWLKENSEISDKIICKSWPQIEYYSERETLTIPNQGELSSLIFSDKNIKFYVVSIYEPHQQWMYSFPQENNFTILQTYFADVSRTKPLLIIYKI